MEHNRFFVPDTNISADKPVRVSKVDVRGSTHFNVSPADPPRGVELDHKSVFNSTPFEFKIIDPVESLHLFKACAVIKIFVSPTKTELVAVHPRLSVIVIPYVPPAKFVMESVVFGIGPALCVNPLGPFQSYV